MLQLPPEIPSWIPTVLTAIGGVATGLVTGVLTYRSQGKQLKNDFSKVQTELKRAGTEEFEAINAGNKALREALMEQVKSANDQAKAANIECDRIRKEHDECDAKTDVLYRRIRHLENLLHSNNIVFEKVDND